MYACVKPRSKILVYVLEDIPSKFITLENCSTKVLFIELSLKHKKRLLCSNYNPHRCFISDHLSTLRKNPDFYLQIMTISCSKLVVEDNNDSLKDFRDLYNLKHIIKVPTCVRGSASPACMDLLLTNASKSFLSDKLLENCRMTLDIMAPKILRENHSRSPFMRNIL